MTEILGCRVGLHFRKQLIAQSNLTFITAFGYNREYEMYLLYQFP